MPATMNVGNPLYKPGTLDVSPIPVGTEKASTVLSALGTATCRLLVKAATRQFVSEDKRTFAITQLGFYSWYWKILGICCHPSFKSKKERCLR